MTKGIRYKHPLGRNQWAVSFGDGIINQSIGSDSKIGSCPPIGEWNVFLQLEKFKGTPPKVWSFCKQALAPTTTTTMTSSAASTTTTSNNRLINNLMIKGLIHSIDRLRRTPTALAEIICENYPTAFPTAKCPDLGKLINRINNSRIRKCPPAQTDTTQREAKVTEIMTVQNYNDLHRLMQELIRLRFTSVTDIPFPGECSDLSMSNQLRRWDTMWVKGSTKRTRAGIEV